MHTKLTTSELDIAVKKEFGYESNDWSTEDDYSELIIGILAGLLAGTFIAGYLLPFLIK